MGVGTCRSRWRCWLAFTVSGGSHVLVNWKWYAPDFWCFPASHVWVARIRVALTTGAGRLKPSWRDVISSKHGCPGLRVILVVLLPLSLRKVSQHVCVSGFGVGQSASLRVCLCVRECGSWGRLWWYVFLSVNGGFWQFSLLCTGLP